MHTAITARSTYTKHNVGVTLTTAHSPHAIPRPALSLQVLSSFISFVPAVAFVTLAAGLADLNQCDLNH